MGGRKWRTITIEPLAGRFEGGAMEVRSAIASRPTRRRGSSSPSQISALEIGTSTVSVSDEMADAARTASAEPASARSTIPINSATTRMRSIKSLLNGQWATRATGNASPVPPRRVDWRLTRSIVIPLPVVLFPGPAGGAPVRMPAIRRCPRKSCSRQPADRTYFPAIFTSHCTPNLSVHIPNVSPHGAFSSGIVTLPPGESLSQ